MYRILIITCLFFLMGLTVMSLTADAQDKVTGPWLWIVTPDSGGCGAAATHRDEIKAQTGNKLTEEDVARNGITNKILRVEFDAGHEWTEGEIAPTGGSNLNDMLNRIRLGPAGGIDNHCAYAVINAKARKAVTRATGRVGSDDSVKVWVNGKVVHSNAVNRGASDFQDTFNVDLKAGDNVIMVKVCECGGGWSMFFGIQADVDYNLNFQGWTVEPIAKLTIQWAEVKKSY